MRTLTELEDALARDLAWRRTEMQSMLGAVRANAGPAGLSFRRGGLAMLYAHWEGYAKNGLASYWQYVAKKRLTYGDLALNFVALGIERELIRAQGISAGERLLQRVKRLDACASDRALMSERDIDTQSNLNSQVLSGLLASLGLDPSYFVTKAHFIDYSLLRQRNSIAHGDFLDVTVHGYVETHHEVLGLLEGIRTAVTNAAARRLYRRNP
ncbi:MAG TPA: MAE_28990/MAE_18760 family HEPN-like nuclease [Mycobacteriales bacterium]|jgi:hypothetical protein|nr:MAE_28990/MAE_18760 family HEPN-like nuclease [Mycobacteriales bacterium]